MNLQALFDGILAGVALWVAWGAGRQMPALRLGAAILGAAAVLGTLRFSGVLPLPEAHQALSMFGATVGLPLLGLAALWPRGVVATQTRYAWIFGVSAAVVAVLVVVVGGFKLWASICALLAVLTALIATARRREGWGVAASALLMLGLLAFATKLQTGPLVPGDWLHIGLSLGLWAYVRWVRVSSAQTPAP